MASSCCRSRCRWSIGRKFEWRRANPLGSLKLLRSHHELHRPGLGQLSLLPRSPGAAQRLCAVCRTSLRLGCKGGGADPGGGRYLQHCRPGRAGEAGHATAGRAAGAAGRDSSSGRRGSRCTAWPIAGATFLLGGSRLRADRALQPGGAADDDAKGGALGTGRAAGRQQQCDGDRRAAGAGALYPDLRLLHPAHGVADSRARRFCWRRC